MDPVFKNVFINGCLLLGLVMGLFQCEKASREKGPSSQVIGLSSHASSQEVRLRAVTLSYADLRKVAPGHVLKARHAVSAWVAGKVDRSYVEEVTLSCTAKGRCRGRYNTDQETGMEFVLASPHIYFRQRYQPFLRFEEEPEESLLRLENVWSVVTAPFALIKRYLHLVPKGDQKGAGRTGSLYRVERKVGAFPSKGTLRHRAWRDSLLVTRLEGDVVLDRVTGVPLSLKLSYEVTVTKNKFPIQLKGTLEATMTSFGEDPTVPIPSKFTIASPLQRDKVDEDQLLKGTQLNPGWFRGGGSQTDTGSSPPAKARRGAPRRQGPKGPSK